MLLAHASSKFSNISAKLKDFSPNEMFRSFYFIIQYHYSICRL